jgi:hypothetical protein
MVTVDVTTRGTERLVRLAAAIRDAGDKGLQKELMRAMQRSTRPLKKAARDGAIQILPHRGGLAERVAASRFAAQTRTRGKGAGVRIKGASDMDISAMNRGRLRHPVYGKWRKGTPTQLVRPGWFDDSLTIEAQGVRDEIERALDDLGRKLEAKT